MTRNCRLSRIIELNFANVFVIQINNDNDVVKLTIRKFISKHKINWFKKIIVVAYAVIVVFVDNNLFHDEQSSIIVVFFVVNIFILNISFIAFAIVSIVSKIIFNNDIIIHQFNFVVVQIFTNLIQKYFDLWKNKKLQNFRKNIKWKYFWNQIERNAFSTKLKFISSTQKIVNW